VGWFSFVRLFFFSSRRRHTRSYGDWSSDVCSSDLALQGLGGAVVSAAGLSLMMTLFTKPADVAKAMGIVGFISAGGGSVGVLLGGILTSVFSWHAIFMVNIPVGVAVYILALRIVPSARPAASGARIDIAGAVTVPASLMLAVYAIVTGNEAGWTSAQTVGLTAA